MIKTSVAIVIHLKELNKKKGEQLILQELDDKHLFVNKSYFPYIQKEIAEFLNKGMAAAASGSGDT